MPFNSTTQPAIGLSLLCLLLDIAKKLHEAEDPSSEFLVVDHVYFYDNSFNYGSLDRLGGVLSHLCRVFKRELTEALGPDHEMLQPQPQPPVESNNFLREFYSTVFLVRSNNAEGGGSYSVLQNLSNEQHESTTIEAPAISPGNVDNHKSICEIIDCAIMFFQSVSYKYVVMIADLRDNISHLSNILIETKNCRDEVQRNLEEYKNSIEGFSSSHDEVLRELSDKFAERKNIFAVRFKSNYLNNLIKSYRFLETFNRASTQASVVSFCSARQTTKRSLMLAKRMCF